MKTHRAVRFVFLPLLLTACGGEGLHLAGKGPDPADITVDGSRGKVTWQWGPKAAAEDATAVKQTIHKSPAGLSGTIDLTLANGQHVFLVGEHSTFACRHGCSELHMPQLWVVADD